MADFTDDKRRIQLTTPLGPNVLLVSGVSGSEGISELFEFQLDLVSDKQRDIKPDQLIGKPVTLAMQMDAGSFRYVNGIVARFGRTGNLVDFASYSMEVVPKLWFLTKTTDCRVFQNKSVPDIIKIILGEYQISDVSYELEDVHPTHDFVMQYRESDYNFISRLCEEEGIFFFFEHSDGSHRLKFGDANSSLESSIALHPNMRYVHTDGLQREEDNLESFTLDQEVASGRSTFQDYNFEKPLQDLTVQKKGKDKRSLETFDYPGEYQNLQDGEKIALWRQQLRDGERDQAQGSSANRSFTPGFSFQLDGKADHPTFSGKYILTRVTHQASQEGDFGAGEGGDEFTYRNAFEATPAENPYRPPMVTPEPRVFGAQTAMVVGPEGEEIFTDEYGRVLVQFFWDREGEYDAGRDPVWLRVRQDVAGNRWGSMFIPRVGQEVLVDFLEGDPDRPIVTGCLYNGVQKPAYDLPQHKTRSYIKTCSSSGGSGFNELRFEDKKGKEQVFIHAERMMDTRIGVDHKETTGRDYHLHIGTKRNKEPIGSKYEWVELEKHVIVGDEEYRLNEKSVRTRIREDSLTVCERDRAERVAGESYLQARSIIFEADMAISFKVAGNLIKIDPSGITVNGIMVRINSGGAAQPSSASGKLGDVTDPEEAQEADHAKSGTPSNRDIRPKPAKPEPPVLS